MSKGKHHYLLLAPAVRGLRGTWLVPSRMSIGAGLLFFAAFLAASLSAYFVLSNRRLDRIHGRSQLYDPQRSTSHQTDDAETGRMEDDDDNVKVPQRTALASQSKGFRYIA